MRLTAGGALPDHAPRLGRRLGDPWLLDVLITPNHGDRWAFHRDADVVEDIGRVTWSAADGIRYLRPEVALASKAGLTRPKDTADLEALLPLLEPDAKEWLAVLLARVHPGHAWLERLRPPP